MDWFPWKLDTNYLLLLQIPKKFFAGKLKH